MAKSITVEINLAHPVPNAGESESALIVAAWEQAQQYLQNRAFKVEDPFRVETDSYKVSLQAADLIAKLKEALDEGSFALYLQKVHNEGRDIKTTIALTVEPDGTPLELYTLYHAVGVFTHQLMLSLNLAMPGACQFKGASYQGEQAAIAEAPEFCADMFTNGWLSAFEADWPTLQALPFSDVWDWLEMLEISQTDTAIKPLNKVLFGLLEVAQQKQAFGARDVLMVSHMLETLMLMSGFEDPHLLRERIASVLGPLSSKAGTFTELYRMKHAMVRGEHPIRRPSIVIHDADEEILQQLEQHNSPVEQALAIVLALLQDLIRHNSEGYQFTEQMHRIK